MRFQTPYGWTSEEILLEIVCHNNAVDLLARCETFLKLQEAENHNLIQLLRLIAENSGVVTPPYWFCSVEIDGIPVGCCVHASPDGLVASNLSDAAALPVYAALSKEISTPVRLVGSPRFASILAHKIANASGCQAQLSSRWQVYRLDRVTEVANPARGELRLAAEDDYYIVAQWGNAYGDERPSFLDVHEFMLSKLKSGELYFWYDNAHRTMITVSGRGMNAQRISSVFTPKEFRGHGYASTAVAAVSKKLLRDGSAYVVLTAGLGEPVARIYKKIGFYPVADRHSYRIENMDSV